MIFAWPKFNINIALVKHLSPPIYSIFSSTQLAWGCLLCCFYLWCLVLLNTSKYVSTVCVLLNRLVWELALLLLGMVKTLEIVLLVSGFLIEFGLTKMALSMLRQVSYSIWKDIARSIYFLWHGHSFLEINMIQHQKSENIKSKSFFYLYYNLELCVNC